MLTIFSHTWLILWLKKYKFDNLSWHWGCGPFLNSFEGLSKTPPPLDLFQFLNDGSPYCPVMSLLWRLQFRYDIKRRFHKSCQVIRTSKRLFEEVFPSVSNFRLFWSKAAKDDVTTRVQWSPAKTLVYSQMLNVLFQNVLASGIPENSPRVRLPNSTEKV